MFARIINGNLVEYPLTEQQIRERFPNVTFPTVDFSSNLPDEYVRVLPAGVPNPTETTVVTEAAPALIDGQWTQVWTVGDKFKPEELEGYNQQKLEKKWADLRSRRDGELIECDWVVNRHRDQKELGVPTSLTDAQYLAWLSYRQELRDFPAGVTDPDAAVMPTPPGQLGVSGV